ncbi:MAG: hypothetical protein RR654_06345, partial [Oscillospiraceae bacterium]
MSVIDNIAYFGSFMGNAYNIYAQHNGQAGFYIIDDKAALMLMGHYGHLCGKIKNDSELLPSDEEMRRAKEHLLACRNKV